MFFIDNAENCHDKAKTMKTDSRNVQSERLRDCLALFDAVTLNSTLDAWVDTAQAVQIVQAVQAVKKQTLSLRPVTDLQIVSQ